MPRPLPFPVPVICPLTSSLSPASITFTPANYAAPQVVTVTGVDDKVQDGNTTYQVTLGNASTSPQSRSRGHAVWL